MELGNGVFLLALIPVLIIRLAEARTLRAPSFFAENFSVMWADDHVQTDGIAVELLLDRNSGSAFSSKRKYQFGHISMDLKLVPGDSAGVVTAYYLSSDTASDRDELDFEFLGNKSGQPYVLQTNVYSNGKGDREQRVLLWFDPSQDYHTYSFQWNKHQIVFAVDGTPIRVLLNAGRAKDIFPLKQGMRLISSIWDADGWATRGGLDKTDWSKAPFVASYRNFRVDACNEGDEACINDYSRLWNRPQSWSLSSIELARLSWVKSHFLVYDYCADTRRFRSTPAECNTVA